MALAAKKGELPVSQLKGAAKQMYDSMTQEELEDFASTKHKDLPSKKESRLTPQELVESSLTPRKIADILVLASREPERKFYK